jgi:hypothetical protein
MTDWKIFEKNTDISMKSVFEIALMMNSGVVY